jgi:hypothetical protein
MTKKNPTTPPDPVLRVLLALITTEIRIDDIIDPSKIARRAS